MVSHLFIDIAVVAFRLSVCLVVGIGSFSNANGDGNENVTNLHIQ